MAARTPSLEIIQWLEEEGTTAVADWDYSDVTFSVVVT